MKKTLVSMLVLAALLLTACGSQPAAPAPAPTEAPAPAETVAPTEEPKAENSSVASASEMASVESVVEDWMVPVYAKDLKDGTYEITVDSSSSMFNIVACTLTVDNGSMTAAMTMGGKGYLYVYMGTGEEAAAAAESEYVPVEELPSGEHCFTVPVEALDKGLDCAAYSKNKGKWYERTLVFRADSLPMEAFADGALTTAETLGLTDGEYSCAVSLSGGSGKASVQSPAAIRVENGAAYATIIWSSSKYDYMRIGEVKYDMLNTEGNSTFEIPVLCFDRPMAVAADTIAMSEPHEIDYTLTFDSSTLE